VHPVEHSDSVHKLILKNVYIVVFVDAINLELSTTP
jgi:hypothetical protein